MSIIVILLDTGLRVSELTSLMLEDIQLEEGVLKVTRKGRRERLIPIGRTSQRLLWNYITRYRPEPANPRCALIFLTKDGLPLTKNRVQKMMTKYGSRAGIDGVRCSPHTLRHTGAVMFLRNGGDVFTGETFTVPAATKRAALCSVFGIFPIALLVSARC